MIHVMILSVSDYFLPTAKVDHARRKKKGIIFQFLILVLVVEPSSFLFRASSQQRIYDQLVIDLVCGLRSGKKNEKGRNEIGSTLTLSNRRRRRRRNETNLIQS